ECHFRSAYHRQDLSQQSVVHEVQAECLCEHDSAQVANLLVKLRYLRTNSVCPPPAAYPAPAPHLLAAIARTVHSAAQASSDERGHARQALRRSDRRRSRIP